MRKKLSLKAGFDLCLNGKIEDPEINKIEPVSIALNPDDYPGLTLKTAVKAGDEVKAGSPLLFDKICPDITIVSPVCGTVGEIVRGERRKILRVTVTPSDSDASVKFNIGTTAQQLKAALQQCGLWAMIRQRPFDVVADPNTPPRDIFVTAFDSAPLAAYQTMAVDEKLVAKGVKALSTLTNGKIYISDSVPNRLNDIDDAVMVNVSGHHPAGNPGIQAANIAPVNKGETIWTLDIKTLENIGRLVETGSPSYDTLVAITGSEVKKPTLVATKIGCDIKSLVKDNLNENEHIRIISGNVLTGKKVDLDGYLRAPWRQITVIPEGDNADEFMGWASLKPSKMSFSRSFPSKLLHRAFSPDARINGGRRAMIMSGVYDRMIPMDIMPEYLIKAILSHNIEQMEALGIYEVAPEDFALAEYADPSKLELQKIVTDGLAWLRKELM